MSFETAQIRKLRAKLSPRHIKTRDADGIVLSYVEGWYVIAEANRIFGFDGWDRLTLANDCVWTKQQGHRYCAAYVARVRIAVRAGDTLILREGSGVGESSALSPGQAHDFAAKAAETDATKRALMTFGNAFGLSLYAGALGEATERQRQGRASAQASRDAKEQARTPAPSQPTANGAHVRTQAGDMPHAAPALPSVNDTEAAALVHEEPSHQTPAGHGGAIDKSVLSYPEPKRLRDSDHLRHVASQPCLVCGRAPSEAHHLRFAQPRAMGRKVSDEFTVPLCALHHRDLHARGDEEAWWEAKNCAPLAVAEELWRQSRNARRVSTAAS